MPIYMDRHDVSQEVTAENVAQLHQEDLKIQSEYNCRGLTYWFDDKRKTAFCLIEAPNPESVHNMHQHAHGEVPHSIIEVDESLVESFLGRMEDPESQSGEKLTIIDEPAFRFLLTLQIKPLQLLQDLHTVTGCFMQECIELVNDKRGTVVQQNNRSLLASFATVQYALQCGADLVKFSNKKYPQLTLGIGLDAGPPVEGNHSLFENTIRSSQRLCALEKGFSVSPEVIRLFSKEQTDSLPTLKINAISVDEMVFMTKLFDYVDSHFSDVTLDMGTLVSQLGYSRSRAYRYSVKILGFSPNAFLKKYRLEKSLEKLNHNMQSVSETGFLCGFSSSSYFSKCFRQKYGVSPKVYSQSTSS